MSKRSVDDVNILPIERQYPSVPFSNVFSRQGSSSSNSTSTTPHPPTTHKPNPNGPIDKIMSTALGLGVGGIIFYGVFLGGKRKRRSAASVQQSVEILYDSIRKYSLMEEGEQKN